MKCPMARWIVGVVLTLSGCAQGMVGSTERAGRLGVLVTSSAAGDVVVASDDGSDAETYVTVSDAPPSGPRGDEPNHVEAFGDESAHSKPKDDARLTKAVIVPTDEAAPGVESPAAEAALTSESPAAKHQPIAMPDKEVTLAAAPPAGNRVTVRFRNEVTYDEPMPEPVEIVSPPEIVPAPNPATDSPYKPDVGEHWDRFTRSVLDVPVDIRPPEGELPQDLAAERFAGEPTINETLAVSEPPDIFCAYTPWTICYRPLYFEDIALERYGKNVGLLQTGLSGARFFTQVAALPYKMTRRPPRSCQCSNGFSRPGDCPLPGYGNRRFQLDAALVETAVITGIVFIIP